MQSSSFQIPCRPLNPLISQLISQARELTAQDQWTTNYFLTNPSQPQKLPFVPATSYYKQFWRIFLANQMIIAKSKGIDECNKQLDTYCRTLEELMRQTPKKCKKNRRVSAEIEKKFRCPYHGCIKAYGCDVSMNLHIKLKHNGGNKTERESIAVSWGIMQRMICEAEIMGKQPPEVKIKFPPGYLEKFRAMYIGHKNE